MPTEYVEVRGQHNEVFGRSLKTENDGADVKRYIRHAQSSGSV